MTTTKQPVRAAAYLRMSVDNPVGIDRQRDDCTRICHTNGWTLVEYQDNDKSASTGKRRPGYQRLLADIRDGKVSAVVAWDLDRLHRRPVELEEFMDLADAHRLALATVSGDVDLSTAQGRLVARLKGAVARHEIEHKSARQKRAAQQKAEQGRPQWKRAFGYDDNRQPDPVTAPLVREAYRRVLAGGSIHGDVCTLFNDAGALGLNGNRWTASTATLFLRAPRNAGLRSYGAEIVGKGTWPGLVSEATWKAAQAKLNAPGRKGRTPGKPSVRQHLLTGLLFCGKDKCSGHLHGQWVMTAGGEHTINYVCKKCRGVSVRANDIEPLLYDLIGGRLAEEDAVDLLKGDIDPEEAEAIRAELTVLYGRLDEIADERGDGDLTGPQARRATERVQLKIDTLERTQQSDERAQVLADIPVGTPEAVQAVKDLSPDRFRAVVALLMAPAILPVGRGSHNRQFNAGRVIENWHQP
jgi:DNA invertase Pin-like site-specific DNA recombinase